MILIRFLIILIIFNFFTPCLTQWSFFIRVYRYLTCGSGGCCPTSEFNVSKLRKELKEKLYGQPLARKVIETHFVNHVINENPRKALLLSFHGTPGIGKTYVSKIISQVLFDKGEKSRYYKLYIGSKSFFDHDKKHEYQESLKTEIIQLVKECPRSLFIFDEAQSIPPNVLNVIKCFVDEIDNVDGVDFHKATFILLSSSAIEIVNDYLEDSWMKGYPRDEIDLNEVNKKISKYLYTKTDDGLSQSLLIKHGLVTSFVPFFPLEPEHIEKCIDDFLNELYRPDLNNSEIKQKILKKVEFSDNIAGHRFSILGCRKLSDIINGFPIREDL